VGDRDVHDHADFALFAVDVPEVQVSDEGWRACVDDLVQGAGLAPPICFAADGRLDRSVAVGEFAISPAGLDVVVAWQFT